MLSLWIKNSLIMNMISLIFRQEVYKSSLFYKMISSLGASITKALEGSFLRVFFTHKGWEPEAIRESRLMAAFQKISNPLNKVRHFLNSIVQNSFPYRFVIKATDSFVQAPMSTVAFMILPFMLSITILKGFYENFTPKSLLYRAILLVLLFFLLNVKVSLKSLLDFSKTWGIFSWFCDVDLQHRESSGRALHYRDGLEFAAVSFTAGLLYYFLPQTTFIKLFGIVFASTAIYIWPGLGLAMTAFMLPLLPTTYTVGIIGITFLSLLIKGDEINNTIPAAIIPALLFMATAVIAAVFSVMRAESLKVLPLYAAYFMIFYTAAVLFRDSKTIKLVLASIIVSTVFLSLLGIYQYFFIKIPTAEAWVDVEQFPELATRVYATLENPNVLGEYLGLSIPLLAGAFLASDRFRHKFILASVVCMLTLCLVLTFSRGAWLGLAISVLIFALLKEPRLLALIVILALLSPMFLPPVVMNRIASIGSLEDSSNAYRITIWIAALRMIKDYWLTGVGLGLTAFSRVYRDYMIAGASAVHAHNLYLEVCLELGVIGVFSLLWMVFRGFSEALSNVTMNDKMSYIAAGILAALAGHLFHGLFDYVWYSPRIVMAFWMYLGMMSALTSASFTGDDIGERLS